MFRPRKRDEELWDDPDTDDETEDTDGAYDPEEDQGDVDEDDDDLMDDPPEGW